MKPIKVLVHSNYSRLLTGFGKNMKNVLLALNADERFEVAEAGNGIKLGDEPLVPWKFYGTYPSSSELINFGVSNAARKKAMDYGGLCIDDIILDFKPDVYIGIEDIWAFRDYDERPWWDKISTIIWTTLDSMPILEDAKIFAKKSDAFLVWASFAEDALKKEGLPVQTLHGAIDYENFKPLPKEKKEELRLKNNIDLDEFVIGFVFKNQLRKSVPNLLKGFKMFLEHQPKAKLMLHTDWSDTNNGWNIPKLIKELDLDNNLILSCYLCSDCGEAVVLPYSGEDVKCPFCKSEKSLKSKTFSRGCSESQLNELYNLMNVYCHPFTSGGQELPIQEAKAAGLITLVTEYSCGTDSCYPEQGGLPLAWNEYREPMTHFIKATTCPQSICDNLVKVFEMNESEKEKLIESGRDYVLKNFSINSVVDKLKNIIISLPKKKF